MRRLKRQRQRQYERFGKNQRYDELKCQFESKLKEALHKYKEKVENQVRECKRGSIYPILKQMGARPFEAKQPGFQLPAHADQNMSAAKSAEIIAEHFSASDVYSRDCEGKETQQFCPRRFA